MNSIADVSIHLTTSGEMAMDQLHACKRSTNSPAAANVQLFPPGAYTQIRDPSGNLFTVGYQVTGMLVIPPADNLDWYTLTFVPKDPLVDIPDIHYHPTNPQFWSVIHFQSIPYLFHNGPNPLVFRFIWI